MKCFLTILLLYISLFANAQPELEFATYDVHFSKDEFVISPMEKLKLDKYLSSLLVDYDITKVRLVGHTDSDADSLYNIKLSKNRVDQVRQLLLVQYGLKADDVMVDYKGEEAPRVANLDETNMAKNRRVELVLAYQVKENTNKELDTNLLNASTISRCLETAYYDTIDDIIFLCPPCGFICECPPNITNYSAINDPYIAQRTLPPNTVTAEGSPLISGGMFCFNFIPECKDDLVVKKLFQEGAKAYIPITDCNMIPNPKLYVSDTPSNWELDKSKSTLKIVETDNVEYYEITFYQEGCFNVDVNICEAKIKVKPYKKAKIIDLTFSNDCPLTLGAFEIGKKFYYANVPITDIELSGKLYYNNDTILVSDSWGNLNRKPSLTSGFKGKKCSKKKVLFFNRWTQRITKKVKLKSLIKKGEQAY